MNLWQFPLRKETNDIITKANSNYNIINCKCSEEAISELMLIGKSYMLKNAVASSGQYGDYKWNLLLLQK